MRHDEHFMLDLSSACVEILEKGVRRLSALPGLTDYVRTELTNLANECRARLQRVMEGDFDKSQGDSDSDAEQSKRPERVHADGADPDGADEA